MRAKYRGKSKYNHKWNFGNLVDCCDGDVFIAETYDVATFELVDPETVGQFVGIPDKNGKEVYEGDIVKTKFGRVCEVIWFSSDSDKCFDLSPINRFYDENKAPDKFDLWRSENIEVIGNIYDNPELRG